MKTIRWLKNSVLCTEHLDSFGDTLKNFIEEIHQSQNPNGYGINNIDIDVVNLSKGMFTIKAVNCIFPDYSVVSYNKDDKLQQRIDGGFDPIYRLELNLLEKVTEGTKYIDIFLTKSDQFIESSREIINELGDKVYLNYKTPKLELLTKLDIGIGLPIAKVVVKNGSFMLGNFIPPCFTVQNEEILKKIENLYVLVNKKALSVRDSILIHNNKDQIVWQNNLLQILDCLDFILHNIMHPFQMYRELRKCISLVLITNFTNYPPIQPYNHNNIWNILDNLTNIIIDYVDEGAGAKRIDFQLDAEGNYFTDFFGIVPEYINLLISPINESLIPKIKICSKSYVEEVMFKRIIGAKRSITKITGNTMVIQVSTQDFIVANEPIYIVGAENCSQISILKE